MPIELAHLGPHTLAGASHAEVVARFLAAAGVDPDAGTTVRLDARHPELARQIAARRRVVDPEGVALLDGEGFRDDPPAIVPARSLAHPVQRAQLERLFVDLLLDALVGVTLHDPARIWIEAGVRVAPGAVLWPGVVLRGATTVEAAEIGPGAVLTDTHVAAGAVVLPYTVCDGATIGAEASVGPMAHLRPRAQLGAGVKVGNFVEVKNTTLADGAKASHLTYLGDAEVGAGANVGAGTITCNYDGHNKWQTTIGAGAFIGSNTALVAPIHVGDGAIVGAGSTLTADVPADALALERATPRVVKNAAPRIHAKNRAARQHRADQEGR